MRTKWQYDLQISISLDLLDAERDSKKVQRFIVPLSKYGAQLGTKDL
jgi:hypothetical protein